MSDILQLSASDNQGGAARAAYRLQEGLRGLGLDSRMLVQIKSGDDPFVTGPFSLSAKWLARLRRFVDRLPASLRLLCFQSFFHLQWVPDGLRPGILNNNPQIIHLHWICGGFVRIESPAGFGKPVVWTLHDMWPFTGGCHYAGDCKRYELECGKCPQLDSGKEKDLSRWVWLRKQRAWQQVDITVVTPSCWLAACAGKSALFKPRRIEVIPNGINTSLYKPVEKEKARRELKLPPGKRLVLFGAVNAVTEKRKGPHLLYEALRSLSNEGEMRDLELVVFGSERPDSEPDLGFKAHYFGHLSRDERIAQLYSACDVFAAPSLEDNLPNTIMEAMACGTPCVAFGIGGIPDMIEHEKNGYLATAFEAESLAAGIDWVLNDDERWKSLSAQARKKAEQVYDIDVIAGRYRDLYEDILHRG